MFELFETGSDTNIDSYLTIFELKNVLGRLVSPRSLRNRVILVTAKCN